jgi:hypothetical protein
MFRISGSDFVRSLALTVACVALSLSLGGCSSSDSTNNDAGGDTGSSTCDLTGAEAVFTAKCAYSGCHDNMTKLSGLDLSAGSDLGTRLLGGMPGTLSMMCGSNTTHYLTAGTNPATGLLLSKVSTSPACGAIMPFGATTTSGRLSTTEIACLTSWATTVTSP